MTELTSVNPPGFRLSDQSRLVLRKDVEYRFERVLQRWLPAVSFKSEGSLAATGQGVEFAFSFLPIDLRGADEVGGTATLQALGLVIRNSSDSSIAIDWDAVSLIGRNGTTHPVTHRGIKYANAASPMPASTVPPSATLEDFVFPRDAIYFMPGRSGGWGGRQFFERMAPGDGFTLFLPTRRRAETVEYTFSFTMKASGVPLSPRAPSTSARSRSRRAVGIWSGP